MIIHERIPPLLYEYSISSSSQDGLNLPRLILKTGGFKDDAISETISRNRCSLEVFSEDKKKIEILHKTFKRLKLPGLVLGSKSLKPAQWLTRWKSQWKPLSLTKRIDVVPFWYKDKYKTTKEVIVLDTLMSFGTGLHETTQLIAQLIEDSRLKFESFLDIGTGTGILTLVALKNGAKTATALDISPLSIEAAKSNLKANALNAKCVLGDINQLPSNPKYDVVAANLITNDLLKYRRKILSLVKPGGILLTSGISLDNLDKINKGFNVPSLIPRKISKGKEWAAILYVKKMS